MKYFKNFYKLLLCGLLVVNNGSLITTIHAEETETEQSEEVQDTKTVYESGTLVVDNEDYKVEVSYDAEASIPNNATLVVEEIKNNDTEYNTYLETTAEKVFENENTEANTLPYARFFDITILDENNNEIEPANTVNVSIDLKDHALDTEDVTFSGIHFKEDGTDLIELNTEETASFDADSFSVYGVVYYYTVDFYYGDYEYHMNGGSEMMLSELFQKLGIEKSTSTITDVLFTDDSLVTFTNEGEDYRITSLKPFITSEALTITFADGETINISVEDAASGTIDGNVYFWMEGTKLIIRPLNNRTELNQICFNTSKTAANAWPWNDQRSKITEIEFRPNNDGAITSFAGHGGITANFMFANMPNLKKVTGLEYFDTTNAAGLARMFSNCGNLESIDLSSLKNNGKIQNMQNMFRDCTKLKTVMMPDAENFKLKDDALLSDMFQNSGIENIEWNDFDVTNAKTMTDMFRDCTSLKTLDVSSFGKLNNIVNMDGFVANCSNLETLILDNLDNSAISALNYYHTPNNGRMIFGFDDYTGKGASIDSTLPNLKTISAKNSKVWMVENQKGNPGSEYFSAENNNAVYYFTGKQLELQSDVGPTVTIETKRDYVDMITDRAESDDRGLDSHSEANTNKNMAGGQHLNTNGAGFLTPGVYTILDDTRQDTTVEAPLTYYRITEMGKPETTYEVSLVDDLDGVLVQSGNAIITAERDRSFWTSDGNDKVLEKLEGNEPKTLATITYHNAATDINGEKHDVVVEVKRITFKDVNNIPDVSTYERRDHDENRIAGDTYYRTVLEALDDRISLNNYVYSTNWQGWDSTTYNWPERVLSNGSGTYIDFDIKVKDAIDGTSVLFYIDDLDVPHSQTWNNGDDACFDTLTWDGVHYGDGSEGMKLGTGNDIDTLSFADHTGLQLLNRNYIVATGSDPSTSWSEFYVRANAKKASYTWTSGIACDTYILKNTQPVPAPEPVWVMPEAIKYVNNARPGGEYADKYFDFTFAPAADVNGVNYTYNGKTRSVVSLANNASETQNIKNTNEYVTIKELELPVPTSNDPVKYIYEIKELEGTAGDIISYDTDTKHYMQIVVFRPANDIEMYQGTRAEIVLGTKHGDNEISWNADEIYTVYSTNAQLVDGEYGPNGEPVYKDAQGIKFYRVDDKYFNYEDDSEMKPTTHAKVDRTVSYNDKTYTVKVDKNGVEYFEDDNGKYRDPNHPDKVLVQAREGDIDPETVENDSPVAKEKMVNGEVVYKDVHGVEYYGEYYDTSGNELTVEDGKFNPQSSDKTVYENKTSSTGETIYKHANGQEYFVKDGKYYDANDESKELVMKAGGEVDPLPSDDTAKVNEVQTKPLKETFSGNGNVVYLEPIHNVEYYQNTQDGNYYTRYGTLLEPGSPDFTPSTSDEVITISREIWEDGDGTRFYKNEGHYYRDGDDSRINALSDGTLDTSEVIEIGSFNNRTNVSDITIIKDTEDNKAGKFKVHVKFDNGFEPKYVVYEPASEATFSKVDGEEDTWEFTIEEGQRMTIKEVPFNTTYTISEPVEANGWELVSIKDKDGNDSVSKTITTKKADEDEYDKNYEHTITNRFTEVLVNKVVEEGSKTREFNFTATITVTGDANSEFTYGWLNETDSEFKKDTIDDTGEKTVTVEFKLKHKEDIALVVPLNAKVSIEEEQGRYDVEYSVDGGERVATNPTEDITIDTDKKEVNIYNNTDTLTLIKHWEDSDNVDGFRPDDIVGTITYQDENGEEVTIKTSENGGWEKDGNTWTFSMEAPANITVTDFGEESEPKGYQHDKSLDVKDDENMVYEFTNVTLPPVVTTEEKTATRTITFTEYTPDGKQVAKTVVQTVTVQRTKTYYPGTEKTEYSEWKIVSGDYGAVPVPKVDGWTPNTNNVAAWNIDPNNLQDVTIHVVYTKNPVPPKPEKEETTPESGDTLHTKEYMFLCIAMLVISLGSIYLRKKYN